MERKIGEIFEYNGEWYQCMKGNTCNDCAFYRSSCGSLTGKGSCRHDFRGDATNVIFKKLEKVGEPTRIAGRDVQLLRTIIKSCNGCIFYKDPHCLNPTNGRMDCGNMEDGIYIEIKQNKEDMEEKTIKIKKEDIKIGNKVICLSNSKPYVITETNCRMKYDGDWHDCVIYTPLYDNPFKCFVRPIEDFAQNFMLDSAEEKEEKHSNLESTGKNLKPFDLEAAKAGKPVCTRDGKKARIICFDKQEGFPIITLVETKVNDRISEEIALFNINGRAVSDDIDSKLDLMMLPEKKEGWVVVSQNEGGYTFVDNNIFDNEESADRFNLAGVKKIAVIKIEWEG